MKQEVQEQPREPSLPSLPSLPATPILTLLPKRPRTISANITTPPRPLKKPITKKPAQQADSLVRTRKQKRKESPCSGALTDEEGGGEVPGRQRGPKRSP